MSSCLSQISADFLKYQLIIFLISLTGNSITIKSSQKINLIKFDIKENTPVGEIIGHVDRPGFSPPYYIDNPNIDKFSISKVTGIIKVAGLIDREKQSSYSFVLISVNGGDTRSIEINVLDVNDNEPKFNTTSLEKTIPENYPIGSKVDLTTVYDPDQGNNSIASVKIISGDSEKVFAIDYHDSSNGIFYIRLILKQSLDYETVSQFNLVIQAVDGGIPPLQSILIVKIVIQNANDNVPKFDLSRYIASIKENQEVNKTFLRVRATDNDAGVSGELSYILENNSPSYDYFAVDHKTGNVFLRKSLDFETAKSHQITIKVRDNSPPFHTSKVPVIIDVIDINDNPPQIFVLWTEGSSKINRDIDPNTIIAHIKLTDDDAISTSFDLKILNKSPFQLIKILPKMWELKIMREILDLTSNSINITLKATDFPEPSLTSVETVCITIEDSSSTGNIFLRKLFSIELNSPIFSKNQYIITLETIKKSEKQPLFYFYLLNNNVLFKVNKTSGDIYSKTIVDCGIYVLNVSLYSLKSRSVVDFCQIEISIKSDKRLPLYFEKGFRKVLVNLGTNQCFTEITVKNHHCGMKLQYSYDLLLKTDDILRINEYGALCTTENVKNNNLQSKKYLYKIKAHDEKNSSAFCVVYFVPQPSTILNVISNNINITLPLKKDINFNISNPIGKIVGTFGDSSPTQFRGFIQYHILSDELTADTVFLDQQSGELMMKTFPKSKTPIKLTIKTSTSSRSTKPVLSMLTIDFQELYFTKSIYQFFVNKQNIKLKSYAIGKVVVNFVSTQKETVSYYLIDQNEQNSYFYVDQSTGLLIGKSLNSIKQWSVSLKVCADVGNVVKSYAQVLIYFEEEIQQPIFEFANLLVNIWENTTTGTEIMQIFPKYSSESDIYKINQSQYNDWLTIHQKTGQIFLNKQFDREVISYLVITVILTNKLGSTSVDLHLNILDVNDNKPECKSTKINLTMEDKFPLGDKKCVLQCSDADSFTNANLSYKIKMVKPIGIDNPFSINRNTGCLVVTSSLDAWQLNPSGEYQLLITVSDNGPDNSLETYVEVNVVIVDKNNHSPILVSTNEFFLLHSAIYSSEVGTLYFQDMDLGENSEMEIIIKDILYKKCFYIEKVNRNKFIIRVKSLITLNQYQNQFKIYFTVSDKGSPQRSSTFNIVLYIIEANRNSPQIVSPLQNEPIIFSCPLTSGSLIYTVQSVDHDKGFNSKANYSVKILDEDDDYITISSWTGQITTKTTLSCNQIIRIRIFVSDLGFPNLINFVDSFLKPQTEFNNDLRIINQNLTFIIPDNSPPGFVVGDLNIFKESLGAKFLFISNETSTPDNILHIRYDTQQLILLKDNKKVKHIFYPITVNFHKQFLYMNSNIFYVNLIINRIGLSWPIFSEDSPKILKVKENLPPGSFVAKFSVKVLENLSVIFSIRQPNKHFLINPSTGVLITHRSFDRELEIQDQFYVEIIATHVTNPKIYTVYPVQVYIMDENDNSPVIVSPSSSILYVSSPLSVNAVFLRIISKDKDIGINSQLQYRINPTLNNIFQINEISGEIWLTSLPKNSKYELNVTVTDMGNPPKSISVVFSIYFQIIKTKSKIKFSLETLSMNLSLPQSKSGFIIGKLSHSQTSAENLDCRYHLIAGKFSRIFTIDPISGVIKTQNSVSKEEIGNSDVVQITAIIQSQRNPSVYDVGQITINIDYGNLNSPRFSRPSYKIKLPEDEAITDFLTVAAHDPDIGIYGRIVYKLEGDVYDKKIFIDPLTGKLSCSPLNYLEKSLYNLQVIAIDTEGHLSGRKDSTKVSIFVQNTKQHTIAFNSTHFSLKVLENAPAGTTLGRITISKSPVKSEIYYILNPGHSHIRINSTTGELQTNGPIKRESFEFIDLTIHAFAKSNFTSNIQTTSSIIDVRIIDINNSPPIPSENPLKIFVPNSRQPPKPLAKLSAFDADKISNITYHFDENDETTKNLLNHYLLDSKSGHLFLKSSIFNSVKIKHLLKVIVADNGIPNKYTKVLIDISLNHVQKYLQILPENAVFRIKENSIPGTFIGQLKLVNYCRTEFTKFSIIDGVNHELVSLDESTGKIFVGISKNIDREKVENIILWTQVNCEGIEKRGYKKVTIHVDDVDDNKPVFSQSNYIAFINEGQPAKTSVIRITVYDPDLGLNNQVDYFIEFDSMLEEFVIENNGEVKTKIPLNFHTQPVYNLVIKANSKASPLVFAECRLTVYIININDQQPKISTPIQTIRLKSDASVGSYVTKITATDSDGSDGISYRIRYRDLTYHTLFLNIAYDSGEIFLCRKLTISDVGKHELNIVVDDGKFSSSTIVNVEVIDNNNHVPILRENGKTVVLTNSLIRNSVILHLHADDIDHGDNGKVTFDMITPSPWFGLRAFDNNTAVLFLVDDPIERNTPHFLGIQLTDNPIDPQKRLMSISVLTILTKSTSPIAPQVISDQSSIIKISESTSIGCKVTNVKCKDEESNKPILYKIDNSNQLSNYFYMDFETGDLFLTKSLNYSVQQSFLVIITCEVVGAPERITTFNLSLQIEKENKWPDLLRNKTLTVLLKTPDIMKMPVLIASLNNSDRNSFLYSYYLLSVVPNYPENIINHPIFQIDSSKNLWLINGNLLQSQAWKLTIMVVYAKEFPNNLSNLYENWYLYVNVEIPKEILGTLNHCVDIKRLTGVINENEPPKTLILELPKWYHDIKYSMIPNDEFEIFCTKSKMSKCEIKSKTILDFETKEQYRLQVQVTGSYPLMKTCSHTLMVEVFVLDVDEYSPEFTRSSYSHNVEGGIPKLGQILFTVQATDKDRGRFGMVFYRFVEDPPENLGIHNETGEIFMKSDFLEENDNRKRVKRTSNNEETQKTQRKKFNFKISASSGLKSSSAFVLLTILVPDKKPEFPIFTQREIILTAVVSVIIVIAIVICIIFILKRKRVICSNKSDLRKGSNCPSSHTESIRTSNSWNNHSDKRNKSYISKNDSQILPDITQMLPQDLPHSSTQDFSLSEDDNRLTTSSYGTNDQPIIYLSSSGFPIGEERMPLTSVSEINNNNYKFINNKFQHRPCDYFDDSGIENKRICKPGLESSFKYQHSNTSLSSSSAYSSINYPQTNALQNTSCNIQYFNNSTFQNPNALNGNSLNMLRNGSNDFPMGQSIQHIDRQKYRNRQSTSSTMLEGNPDNIRAFEMQNIRDYNPQHFSDIRNNNHPRTLPVLPNSSLYPGVPNGFHRNHYHPGMANDLSPSTRSAISIDITVPEMYTQPYSDVTEI